MEQKVNVGEGKDDKDILVGSRLNRWINHNVRCADDVRTQMTTLIYDSVSIDHNSLKMLLTS